MPRHIVRHAVLAIAVSWLPACAPAPPPPPVPISLACDTQVVQAGLILCRTQPGATLRKNGTPAARADDAGLATIGVARDAASPVTIIADPKPEPPAPPPPNPLVAWLAPPAPPAKAAAAPSAPVSVVVAVRTDVTRVVSGVACDKIAARSPEQLAQVAADRAVKAEAWTRINAPVSAEVRFAKPSDGPLTSPFGAERKYVTPGCADYSSVHWGLDIGTPAGWPARAPMAGVVILAQPNMYYEGSAVFIDHGRGLTSMLMHLSRIDVAVGDRVEALQQVGLVGASGRVTGAHMHWAVRWRNELAATRDDDVLLDPALLLDRSAP